MQATAQAVREEKRSVKSGQCFSALGSPRRIWAISSIHGEADRLIKIHDGIMSDIRPGDRIVYLGNYSGYGPSPVKTLEELLTFRRMVLSIPGMLCKDIVYLRGAQEEMWQKLMQLQFSPDPSSILLWMLGRGLSPTLNDYGLSPHDGIVAAREGVMSLTRWTSEVRSTVRRQPGNEAFYSQLRRAAYTAEDIEYPMLFVHAGIDPQKGLDDQGDNFWWAGKSFSSITDPYPPFKRIIRGFDPTHSGISVNCVTATIDGGCGFGGSLVAACFSPEGDIGNLIEA